MHSFKRTQPTSFRRSFPLGVSLSKPFFPKQLNRSKRSDLRIDRHQKRFVVCSLEYEESDLESMRLKDLHEILAKHNIKDYRGRKKRDVIDKIISELKIPKTVDESKKTDLQLDDVSFIQFSNREDLIEKLAQFTLAELKRQLQSHGVTVSGRKMEVVERLASLLEEEQEKIGNTENVFAIPFKCRFQLNDLKSMDEKSMRRFLNGRVGLNRIHYDHFVNVKHFVHCFVLNDEVWTQSDKRETKESLLQLLEESIATLKPINSTNASLRETLKDLGEKAPKTASRKRLIEKVETRFAEMSQSFQSTTEIVQDRVFESLQQWLEEIQDQLAQTSAIEDIQSMTNEKVQSKMEEMGLFDATEDDGRRLLKAIELNKIGFYPRSLVLLASQILHRLLLLPVKTLQWTLDVQSDQKEKMENSEAFNHVARMAFLEAVPSAFDALHQSVTELEQNTKDVLEAIQDLQEDQKDDEEPTTVPDPPVSIGIVFGGAITRAREIFASVHNLLDHLQTAPFSASPFVNIEDEEASGMRVALYFIANSDSGTFVYRVTAAEILSLGTSAFLNSDTEIWNFGEKFEDFGNFLTELESMDRIFTLTPSLDVLASRNPEHAEQLKALDFSFVGSHSVPRRLTTDRYKCLTYLRQKGFPVPPIFKIQKSDLENLEIWNQRFRKWCFSHGLHSTNQEFHIRPSNPHDRFQRLDCDGVGEVVDRARTVFEYAGMEEAIIQSVPDAERQIDFSCVVIGSENGPIALQPTEYERLPPELVRSLSSPMRQHTPPRFTKEKVQAMRKVAVRVFRELQLSGYGCIHGRICLDPKKEEALKNEEIEYPRPIPDMPDAWLEEPWPDAFLEHIDELYKEEEKELDEIVKSYDESKYTLETLRYFQALDEEDAKGEGNITNRYRILKTIIENIRHRNDPEPDPTPLEILEEQEESSEDDLDDDDEIKTPKEISEGEDFAIVITGVDSLISFTATSLIFQQAAVCGLSHSAVLRHLLDYAIPEMWKLPESDPVSQKWHPLYPEHFVGEIFDASIEQRPKQVWILCGGDGTGHQASLASGINAMLKLNRSENVEAYLFIIDPSRRTCASPEVLKGLQDRRNSLIKQNVAEEAFMEEITSDFIASPLAKPLDLPWRMVWCLNYAHCLSSTIDEAVEAAERFRLLEITAPLAQDTLTTDFAENLKICQTELDKAGVRGVASTWGGEPDTLPPPPRMMTLEIFAADAVAVDATVFIAVHGDIAQDGSLQHFLNSYQLFYTGSGLTSALLCGDKEQLSQHLEKIDMACSLPQRFAVLPELTECGEDQTKAEAFFEETADLLGTRDFVIKPTRDGFGSGVARLTNVVNLHVYGKALSKRWEAIHGHQLSTNHCTVAMPKPQALEYLIEPFIPPAKPFQSIADGFDNLDPPAVVEVSFGLVGDLGRMWVFNPSMILTHLESNESLEDRYLRGTKSVLTPIPDTVVHPRAIQNAKRTVERLADALGLKGVARVDAFMHTYSGQLTILEVETTPYLGEFSMIFQQAVLENPPMYPDEVFQQILETAKTVDPEASNFEAEDGENVPSMERWDPENDAFWKNENLDDEDDDDASESEETLSDLWQDDEETSLLDESRVQRTI